MTNKEQLVAKIATNENNLIALEAKKEKLERNIENLKNKIENQKFQLSHLKKEIEIPERSQAKEGDSSQLSIEDQILSQR